MRTVENGLRWAIPIGMPVRLDAGDVAVDAARGDNGRLGLHREGRAIDLSRAADPGDAPSRNLQSLDAVIEQQFQFAGIRMAAQHFDHPCRQAMAGAPHDMPARNRVAVAVQPALDPQWHRQKANAIALQEVINVAPAIGHIGFGPSTRMVVNAAIGSEFSERQPVLQGEFGTVLDAKAALLWGIDEPDTAEALLGQPTEIGLAVAVHDEHALTQPKKIEGRNDSRDAAADNDHVGFVTHHVSPPVVAPAPN